MTYDAFGPPRGSGSFARSLSFNVAFWAWTALMAIALLPLLLAPPRTLMAGVRVWMRGVQDLLRTTIGLTYEVRGLDRLPAGPAILAAKHQSAWETMAFHLMVPDLVVALKRELLQLPFFGWFARRTGMIGIDRGQGARAVRSLVREARVAAARGERILIFPEGTRVAPGRRVSYLPGVSALYARLDLPVVPVALNSGLFWGRRSFIKRPGRIVVEFLPPLPAGLERRAFEALLAERLEAATARLMAEAGATPPEPGGNRPAAGARDRRAAGR